MALLGCQQLLYAGAFTSQQLPYWIAAYAHAFEFFGCPPRIVVCDNTCGRG